MNLNERVRGAEVEERMTFGEHLEELRWRLLKAIVGLLLVVIGCLALYDPLVVFISEPHFVAMEMMGLDRDDAKFLAISHTGPIIAMMKLALIVSIFVTSPWLGYQIWAFVSAGLYKHERKYVVLFAPISFIMFGLGCWFGYSILVPLALFGLAGMLPPGVVELSFSFSEYLGLVMKLTIVLGAVFQVPLLMVFFAKIGLVQPSMYNKWRRAAIVFNVIFAAILTPADIYTMFLVSIPLLLLYEVGVVVSYIVVRQPKDGGPGSPTSSPPEPART